MELQLHTRAQAQDGPPPDRSSHERRAGPPFAVEWWLLLPDRKNIYRPARAVCEHDASRHQHAGRPGRDLSEAGVPQRTTRRFDLRRFIRDEQVEIDVSTRLSSEECVGAPPSGNPILDICGVERVERECNVGTRHLEQP
jgi:hypothetical protein